MAKHESWLEYERKYDEGAKDLGNLHDLELITKHKSSNTSGTEADQVGLYCDRGNS